MGWPPSNTIFSSILKGNFSEAASRTQNYVKSGELLTDATNIARIAASGGTDVGAWASAGGKAIGGYKGAGDLTGGYGEKLNKFIGMADLAYGGAAKTASALSSKAGSSILKLTDRATKLINSSGGIISMVQDSPRYDAAQQNQVQSQSALMTGSIGQPPVASFGMSNNVSRFDPSKDKAFLSDDSFKVQADFPNWIIIGAVAYFVFFRK